jgi:glycosyltransferase involved in cell wall biosynthesis
MTRKDFSIVVPLFNGAQYLERCLRALLSQTCPADRYETIVVDNNSIDESASIVRNFDRVTLLHEPVQGSYAARNRGVGRSLGEIVAFTDPDCEPQPDWLEQIRLAMSRPGTGIVLGDRRFASDSGILGMLGAYESALGAHIFTTRSVGSYYAYTNNMAVRRSVLQALDGFGLFARGADSLFLRSALERYGPEVLQYAPHVLVRHLEINGISAYLKKKGIYGRVNRSHELATPTSLPLVTRAALALQIKRDGGSSLATNIGFLGALAAGAGRYEWERRRRPAGTWTSA